MATKQLWINLPIKDPNRSRAFFLAMGFVLNEKHGNDDNSACFFVGDKKVVIMMFKEARFKDVTQSDLVDTHKAAEVLFSLDAESRAEVDEMARKAVAAGGTLFAKAGEKGGWMYGCGFADLDGHRWNVLHMDMSKMPKADKT